MALEEKRSEAKTRTENEYLTRLEERREQILAERRPGDTDEAVARRLCESELELLISVKLGDDFPDTKREAMAAAYRRMQHDRDEAMRELAEEKLSADQYADRLQTALNSLAAEYARLLTVAEYERLFNEKPGEPAALALDPRFIAAP